MIELPIGGNNANNFAEAQFLVLRDLILLHTKENNVVGLIDKLSIDLEDHYMNKLLSIADVSYYGVYKHWFKGKGKERIKKDLCAYLSTVENFGNNIFKVGSSSSSQGQRCFFSLAITVTNCCDRTRGCTWVGS